jgi:signal transduction histidine kinase
LKIDVLTIAKSNRIVFPLACAAAVAMVFISEGSYWQSAGSLTKLGAMGAAHTTIQDLQLSLVDAETGQRGYLLTGRKEYLEPYEAALENINRNLKRLDLHYGDEPKSMEMLGTLHTLTDTKISELALTIRLLAEAKSEEAMQIVLSDKGKKQMDAIRTVSAELLAHEVQKVFIYRKNLYQTLMLSRIGMAALSAISLLALFMYLRQTLAFKKHQQVLQQELQRVEQLERNRLEGEVIERTAQLTELTHHLVTALEDERSRLARNLHDELGALLTSAKLDAARIKSRLTGKAPEALELLAHLVETLNSSIALGRSIIEDLRPSALSTLGLVETLQILAREFSEHSGVEVQCALEPVALQANAELMVYRLVQEAITNITKYAKAKHVWVSLATHHGQVEVSVRDDGIGFDATIPPSSAYGLLGMRFRVEAEGGNLVVTSAPGQGTLIQATLATPTSGSA